MIKFILKFCIPLLISVISLLAFYKIFLFQHFPYPGDLLVSFNFPWYSGGWEGYDSWTTHKEFVAMDSIRQHLPWHKTTFDQIKENFSLPLWNPYNFSGNPHLGNMQTFILNPLNVFPLLLPLFTGWIIFIVIQVPMAITFTYLFARGLKLEKGPSMLAAVAFTFSSYYIYWLEIGIVGHSILYLPLILLSIQKLAEKTTTRHVILLILASTATIFAGHVQTAVFVFITAAAYFLVKIAHNKQKKKTFAAVIACAAITLSLTAIQTLPALELYLNSPLTEPLSKKIFSENFAPTHKFLTLFAQDFFGNPSTSNFWSVHYGDGTFHVGVVPFFFAVVALLFCIKKIDVRFFAGCTFFMILYLTKSPLFLLLQKVEIPFLTGTTPLRETFLLLFSLSILSAFGADEFIKNHKIRKKVYFLTIAFLLMYATLFLSTYILPNLFPSEELKANLLISRRNLVIPTAAFCLFILSLLLQIMSERKKLDLLKNSSIWCAVLVTVLAGVYQLNKVNPSSPEKFFYPEHRIFSWLQDNGGINRFRGESTAYTWDNITAFYKIYSAEGYGVFRIKRYAELFAAQDTKSINQEYERSVAFFSEQNSESRNRLYALTGVKYLLVKDDLARDATVNDIDRRDDRSLIWQDGKFKIYERKDTLPRFWIATNYKVAKDQEIIKDIFDPNYDLHNILLEKEPPLTIPQLETNVSDAQIITYDSNSMSFSLNNNSNSLFFISDAYFPGWNAYVDGKKTEVLRAHYAFRAVPIPTGATLLEMKFEPTSVKVGKLISVFGLMTALLILILNKNKKFI